MPTLRADPVVLPGVVWPSLPPPPPSFHTSTIPHTICALPSQYTHTHTHNTVTSHSQPSPQYTRTADRSSLFGSTSRIVSRTCPYRLVPEPGKGAGLLVPGLWSGSANSSQVRAAVEAVFS